jgi:hypothetical protein
VRVTHLPCGYRLREDPVPTVVPTTAAELWLWRPPPRAMRTSAGRGLVHDLRGPVTIQPKTELGAI